jgi:hypothetical protein
MNMRHLALLLIVAALAGCAVQAPAPVAPPQLPIRVEHREIDELLAYLLHVKGLGNALLTDEIGKLREEAARNATDFTRLKLALALTAGSQTEETEPMTLLEPLLQEAYTGNGELRALAALLYGAAGERRRAREQLQSTQLRVRELQKNHEAALSRAEQQRKQIEELEKRLNAFLTIEKSLLKRGNTPH